LNRITCFLLRNLNRIVAKIIKSDGWCAAGYHFARTPFILKEEGYEDWVHRASNPISAWWGAFTFKYRFPITGGE